MRYNVPSALQMVPVYTLLLVSYPNSAAPISLIDGSALSFVTLLSLCTTRALSFGIPLSLYSCVSLLLAVPFRASIDE